MVCYKTHKPSHETDDNAADNAFTQQIRDRPGTTQRIPKVDFTGFENDKDLQRLVLRYPDLKLQLQTVYGLTLEPGPDEARSWNRQRLPGDGTPKSGSRGGRGRGRGRGDRGRGGGRDAWSKTQSASDERERGPWTQAKGDKEALLVIKRMREGRGELDVASEAMKEFTELCQMKFGEDAGLK